MCVFDVVLWRKKLAVEDTDFRNVALQKRK